MLTVDDEHLFWLPLCYSVLVITLQHSVVYSMAIVSVHLLHLKKIIKMTEHLGVAMAGSQNERSFQELEIEVCWFCVMLKLA